VVIAIIAILAGLLLPVLARSKAQSQIAKCQSNEKQIAACYFIYAQDNSDFLPVASYTYEGGATCLGWYMQIAPYVYTSGANINPTTIFNNQSFISSGITPLACPAANLLQAIPPSTPGAAAYGGYGHNYQYLGYGPGTGSKTADITKPVSCCMNGDGLDPVTSGPPLSYYNYGFLYPPDWAPDNYSGGVVPYVRHGKGGNYCWADGHVSLTTWRILSNGLNGSINWYYMKTPSDTPDAD